MNAPPVVDLRGFRNDDAAELRYLAKVSEAWARRERDGFKPLEAGGGRFPLPDTWQHPSWAPNWPGPHGR